MKTIYFNHEDEFYSLIVDFKEIREYFHYDYEKNPLTDSPTSYQEIDQNSIKYEYFEIDFFLNNCLKGRNQELMKDVADILKENLKKIDFSLFTTADAVADFYSDILIVREGESFHSLQMMIVEIIRENFKKVEKNF